jgi:hypothetical protein
VHSWDYTQISPAYSTQRTRPSVAQRGGTRDGIGHRVYVELRAHRKAGAAEDGEPGSVIVGAGLCGDDAATVPSNPSSSRRAAISCAHRHRLHSRVDASRRARPGGPAHTQRRRRSRFGEGAPLAQPAASARASAQASSRCRSASKIVALQPRSPLRTAASRLRGTARSLCAGLVSTAVAELMPSFTIQNGILGSY